MENTVLAEREVKETLKNGFIFVKLFNDWPGDKGARVLELQKKFDPKVPLPLYVFQLPNGTVVAKIDRVVGKPKFVSALRSTLEAHRGGRTSRRD